ncbi:MULTISPECIES: hypothetical protein [unclassified Bradyrhizobium]|uniref:hypothetical protein n=1 Tax=unclassified Bradyrhizobium TaxID=2631580 RepID=UPI00339AD114
MIAFLLAGQNLREDATALAFYHPRVEEGLRLTFERYARDAEHTLSSAMDVLLAWDRPGEDWGLETALGVLRGMSRAAELQLNLSSASAQRLDRRLEAVAMSAEKRADFERALRDLERFGSADHPAAMLARILVKGAPQMGRSFLPAWHAPHLSDQEIAELRGDKRTQPMIERFIREVLPFSRLHYDVEIIPLVERLAANLRDVFWDALDSVAGPGGPHINVEAISAGALSGEFPDYGRAIERFARSQAETEAWMQNFAADIYKAEEHAVDADVADHLIDEPSEQYFNAREGMEAVVSLRRQREGVTWITATPHRKLLLYALGELIAQSPQKPRIEELELLLAEAEGWVKDQAWRACEQHWDDALSRFLMEELARPDLDSSLRPRLIKIAARSGRDPVPDFVAIADRVTVARRLQMVYDLMATALRDEPKWKDDEAIRRARAELLLQHFGPDERELSLALIDALTSHDLRAAAAKLSKGNLALLNSTLPMLSSDVAGLLCCLAATAGLNIDQAAVRLLSTGEVADGYAAVQAMLIADSAGLRARLFEAMSHKRYNVRRLAFRALTDGATAEERLKLLAAARDHGSDVRRTFADRMESCRWPEAIDALVDFAERRPQLLHASCDGDLVVQVQSRACCCASVGRI